MLYCDKCSLSVSGRPARCPLCQGDLSGQPDGSEKAFPIVAPLVNPHRTLINFIILITVGVGVVCVTLNLSPRSPGWWSLFVVAGLVSFWLSFGVALHKRKSIPQAIIWQTFLFSALAVLWDLFTHFRGWSVDYVVPILCTCAMIAMAVAARITHLRIEDYIIYLIIDSVLGIVPLLLLVMDWLRVDLPSIICIAVSIISLTALFLFEGPTLRGELRRRMHL